METASSSEVTPRRRSAARGRSLGLIAAVAALSLGVAACGGKSDANSAEAKGKGTAASSFDKYNQMSGSERTDALEAAAKKEGKLQIYTASQGIPVVAEAFEKKYGIKVDTYVGESDGVAQRIDQEYKAGHYTVDVFEDTDAYGTAKEGLGYGYVNDDVTSNITGYDADLQAVPDRLSVYSYAWNPTQVDEADLPDTLDGFTDPKWKGKLSLDPSNWLWYTGVRHYYEDQGWSDDKIDDMIKTLASYSQFNERATIQAQMLMAGQFGVSLSIYPQNVLRAHDDDPNAPIEWRKSDGSYIKPLIVEPNGALLMKNAPHPAAAELFLDFLLTDGQQILSDNDHTPPATPVANGPLEGVDPADLQNSVDFDAYLNDADKWDSQWKGLTGQ